LIRKNYIVNRKSGLRKKRRIKRLALWIGLFVVLFGGSVYGAFFSGWTDIKDIAVLGTDKISADDVRSEAQRYMASSFFGLPKCNYWLFSPSDMKEMLTERFRGAVDIKVAKAFPDHTQIIIAEPKYAALWCKSGEDKCYFVDDRGYLYVEFLGYADDRPKKFAEPDDRG
jgi:cell division septal protein FtsQ